MQSDHFSHKSWTSLKEGLLQSFFVQKLSAAKVVRHSLAYLSMHKWLVGTSFKCKFCSLSEPPLGVAAVCISAFRKSDADTICITMITMQYEIYNSVHHRLTTLTEIFGCILRSRISTDKIVVE